MASRIGVAVLNLILLCSICMFGNTISISIAVMKTASVIVMRNVQLLVLPLLSMICTTAFSMFWINGYMHLWACAKISNSQDGSFMKDFEFSTM